MAVIPKDRKRAGGKGVRGLATDAMQLPCPMWGMKIDRITSRDTRMTPKTESPVNGDSLDHPRLSETLRITTNRKWAWGVQIVW